MRGMGRGCLGVRERLNGSAMLRSELIRSAAKLQMAFHASGLMQLTRYSRETRTIKEYLPSYGIWILQSEQFGEVEREILRIFDLHMLLDEPWWNSLFDQIAGKDRSELDQETRF